MGGMPRRPRNDAPGRRHHVVNRATGRRPFFDVKRDYLFMQSLLEEAVDAGRILVLAYSLMGTHYHILLESLDGNLSRTMRWIQSKYVAQFNRTRERVGALVQGRFFSQPVQTLAYLLIVLRYIDLNPVVPRVCTDPFAYPYGSAMYQVEETPSVKWLSRTLIDPLLDPLLQSGLSRPDAYRRLFRLDLDLPGAGRLVESRLEHPSREADCLDDLFCAHGSDWLEWFRRRALEADGTALGLPTADADSILDAVAHKKPCAPLATMPARRGRPRSLWDVAVTGLLRDLGGLTYTAISRRTGVTVSHAKKRHLAHLDAIQTDEIYGSLVVEVAVDALERCFGPIVRIVADQIARSQLRKKGEKMV